MTYIPDKPDEGPSPLDDVDIIRENFSSFATIFSENHTSLNNINRGDHEKIIFELSAQDPEVTQDLVALYSKIASSQAFSDQPELFYRIKKFLPNSFDTTDAANSPMQITYNQANVTGPIYQSFLIGGYLFYIGQETGNTSPNVKLSISVTLTPAPSSILSVIATANTLTSSGSPFTSVIKLDTLSSDKFLILSDSNFSGGSIPYSFRWVAIGKV